MFSAFCVEGLTRVLGSGTVGGPCRAPFSTLFLRVLDWIWTGATGAFGTMGSSSLGLVEGFLAFRWLAPVPGVGHRLGCFDLIRI